MTEVGTKVVVSAFLSVCECGDEGVDIDSASFVEAGGVSERLGGESGNRVEPDRNEDLLVCILGDLRRPRRAEWRGICREDRDEGCVMTSVRNNCEDAGR